MKKSDTDLREERISREVVFQGRMLRLERDTVRLPQGGKTTREVVRHPGAVGIVARLEERVLLVRQFRYPIGDVTLEIPAGKLDPGEGLLSCAERELREETGYRGTMVPLGTFCTTPGFSDEIMHLYLARDLVWDPLVPDEDEFLAVEALDWAEAVTRARGGGFRDAKTVLALLLAAERLK
ncbi:Nudix hydrolase domain protein [Acididesulfobacillus acetoxydans]|uniref:ADP-ribose pyrophosphatase n=1 Tax=Acididesulfobacillus acetoxydans TaxID=1561005 RepID=A0A8S0Y3I1_9FIRM|nr:NUDIX hydrolase [Acididesulfobacillus acetoxydans]CAA7602095.1 Nudix hydrolase domain protein [Acididesulfobacillus acetoxydans]CEJ08062.1 ADP-ribose pyrophosphatase [Acididesulfobacillus acetoxydans]